MKLILYTFLGSVVVTALLWAWITKYYKDNDL